MCNFDKKPHPQHLVPETKRKSPHNIVRALRKER
jgi:hypothetical protein